MIVPIALLLLLLSGLFIFIGLRKKNRKVLVFINVIWWLLSSVSAFFTGWAWLERSYSENWAMYGFFFISAPIIITISLLAIFVVWIVRAKKIENLRGLEVSLYLLLLFLAVQAVIGLLVGR